MKKKYYSLLLLIVFTIACQNRKVMPYKNVLETTLGVENYEIGSNLPILKSYTNRTGFTDDLLIDTPEIFIKNEKLYVADSYNKRISIFPIENPISSKSILTISNKGSNYSFARPYSIYADRYDNIYALASIKDLESYEVQTYSNHTFNLKRYQAFQEEIQNISQNNFYIYKFSPKGNFLFRIGMRGKKSIPMEFPNKIHGDNFGNLYVYYSAYDKNTEQTYQLVHRYSTTGQLDLEFKSLDIENSTNLNGTNYQGIVTSIENSIDNQLVIIMEFQPTTNDKNEQVLSSMDNLWSSLSIYSIKEQKITQSILLEKNSTANILGIDNKGRIFLQSYDEDSSNLKIQIFDSSLENIASRYAPIHSNYYIMNDYLISFSGEVYNSVIDRQQKFILLHWNAD